MVSIFFYIKENESDNEKLLIHECENNKADKYGDFLNYPLSHYETWEKYYYKKYNVDFDYFPRGRVVYNVKEKCYYIYFDKCIKNRDLVLKKYKNLNYKECTDLHYQCHICNKKYV